MNYQALCEKIKSGEITLDYCRHQPGDEQKHILRHYENNVQNAAGAADGKWTCRDGETMETMNARMRAHYQSSLDREITEGEPIVWVMGDACKCFHCGHRVYWVLDGAKLSLRGKHENKDFVATTDPCSHAVLQPKTGVIRVTSRLIFANFFRFVEDAPEGQKYSEGYDLGTHRGREGITQFKAGHNIAYGQMGNMSLGVFVRPDNRSIILGDPYIADKRAEEEYELDDEIPDEEWDRMSQIEGHQLVGQISLAVWRWEATDLATLGQKNYEELLQEDQDVVEVEAVHGSWRFRHFFDSDPAPSPEVYARFELITEDESQG